MGLLAIHCEGLVTPIHNPAAVSLQPGFENVSRIDSRSVEIANCVGKTREAWDASLLGRIRDRLTLLHPGEKAWIRFFPSFSCTRISTFRSASSRIFRHVLDNLMPSSKIFNNSSSGSSPRSSSVTIVSNLASESSNFGGSHRFLVFSPLTNPDQSVVIRIRR